MMNSQVGFVLKVFLVSTGLSVFLKYGAPFLPIPPTSLAALVGVLLPFFTVSFALWWRARNEEQPN